MFIWRKNMLKLTRLTNKSKFSLAAGCFSSINHLEIILGYLLSWHHWTNGVPSAQRRRYTCGWVFVNFRGSETIWGPWRSSGTRRWVRIIFATYARDIVSFCREVPWENGVWSPDCFRDWVGYAWYGLPTVPHGAVWCLDAGFLDFMVICLIFWNLLF